MSISPERASGPELIFGLVAPIGVDLDLVTSVLSEKLAEMQYPNAHSIRLTKLMREVPLPLNLAPSPHVQSVKDRIAYANQIRKELGDDALAALAVSAIRTHRRETWPLKRKSLGGAEHKAVTAPDDENPLPNQAYIVRQLKRPEEIALFRRVYGRQFILVSAYAPVTFRVQRIVEMERQSRGGLISDVEAKNLANIILSQDSNEYLDKHGQNVRDAFPLGDVFIDATSRSACEKTLQRFIHLLFGSNEITPTKDEYGMYMAKSASLRSSDLSRQVGAAIFRPSGEIISLGCNEVPKSGGGTYWSDDQPDARDFVQGHDPNDRIKRELLIDLIDRLRKKSHLSEDLLKTDDPYEIAKRLLEDKSIDGLSESKLMDIIEFGRIIHAEMSAITDAARTGSSAFEATLFCTTFPCHLCAKHIVASGLKRVVFLEPYPKSYAFELHQDSIAVEQHNPEKVSFEPFIGVSPFRYRDLFEKGKRKYSGGNAQKWNMDARQPMIEVYFPSYEKAETHVVGSLSNELSMLEERASLPSTEDSKSDSINCLIPAEENEAGPAPTS